MKAQTVTIEATAIIFDDNERQEVLDSLRDLVRQCCSPGQCEDCIPARKLITALEAA